MKILMHHTTRTIIVSATAMIVIAIFAGGCARPIFSSGGSTYLYSYMLEEPQQNPNLLFRNNYIIIQFKFDESALRFQLQNVSEAPLSIVWERVALGINNRYYAVRNGSTLYTSNSNPPTSIEVPPLGYVRDLVMPSDNIYSDNKQWLEKELFPTKDKNSTAMKNYIMKLAGSSVTLKFPLKFGDVTTDYVFTFKVRGIQALPEGTELPPKDRPPAPPLPKRDIGFNQQMTAVLIASGVLGVSVYLMSQKKTSPLD